MTGEKERWRRAISARQRARRYGRADQAKRERHRFDASIQELLGRLPDHAEVAAFLPMASEPNFTVPFPCWIPVQESASHAGEFGWVDESGNLPDRLKFGFPQIESLQTRPDPPVQLALIPALAVDRSGTRLGRGKGWYDRALMKLPARTQLWAVVHFRDVYPKDTLPRFEHDIPVTGAITEHGLIPFDS